MQNNKIGSGLHNLGNTCFFNAVMQIMLYTPSLQVYFRDKIHSNHCNKQDWCIFCALEKLWHQSKKSKVVSPSSIVSNLKSIFKKFRLGRQEDSHQFLRYLVQGMQQAETGKLSKDRQKNQKLISKTATYASFGAKIRTFVLCLNCHYKSLTTQRYYDLSIQCQKSNSLQEGLQNYFKVDDLMGSNKYRCDSCKQLSNAKKGFKLIDIPSAVTFQFKRFTNTLRKIGKIIQYPKFINLGRYMEHEQDQESCKLQLYGVIVHSGSSAGSGHYYAFVKNGSEWFEMNDSNVNRCNEERALRQQAYLLFYRRVKDRSSSTTQNQHPIPQNQIMTNIKDNKKHDIKFTQNNSKVSVQKTEPKKTQTANSKNAKTKLNGNTNRKQSQQQIEQIKTKLSMDIEQLKQELRTQQRKTAKQISNHTQGLKIQLNGKSITSPVFGTQNKQNLSQITNNDTKNNSIEQKASRILQKKDRLKQQRLKQEINGVQQSQQQDQQLEVPEQLQRRRSKDQALSGMGILQILLTYAQKIASLKQKIPRRNPRRGMKSVYNLRKFQIASKKRKLK